MPITEFALKTTPNCTLPPVPNDSLASEYGIVKPAPRFTSTGLTSWAHAGKADRAANARKANVRRKFIQASSDQSTGHSGPGTMQIRQGRLDYFPGSSTS